MALLLLCGDNKVAECNEKDELLSDTVKNGNGNGNGSDSYYSDGNGNGGDNVNYDFKEPRATEKFFRDKFAPFVIRFKYLVMIVFIGLIAVAAYFASQIQGLSEEEAWFPDDHFMQKMTEWPSDYYGGAVSELIHERFVWGVQEWLNRDDWNRWDTQDWGKVEFDDSFDLSPVDAQLHILHVCDVLTNEYRDLLYDPDNTFDCFMYALKDYGENELNLTFPFVFDDQNATNNSIQFRDFMADWTYLNDIGKKYLSDGKVGYDGQEQN